MRIEEQIAEMPARTFEGMLAKVRCAQAYAKEEIESIEFSGGAEVMARSIFEDLMRIGASSTVAIADAPITRDPIFTAIEAHRDAAAAHSECVRKHYALEKTLPRDKRQSPHAGDEIVETDDPRWIETMHAVNQACDAMFDLARRLLDVAPSSLAGATALLNHVSLGSGSDGWTFPDHVNDDETGEEYVPALMRHVGEALRSIGAPCVA
jgi:hypothetical protein